MSGREWKLLFVLIVVSALFAGQAGRTYKDLFSRVSTPFSVTEDNSNNPKTGLKFFISESGNTYMYDGVLGESSRYKEITPEDITLNYEDIQIGDKDIYLDGGDTGYAEYSDEWLTEQGYVLKHRGVDDRGYHIETWYNKTTDTLYTRQSLFPGVPLN